MTVKYTSANIDIEKWDALSDSDKIKIIKAVSKLVTHNAFTKDNIVFLLKEAVRLAEAGTFRQCPTYLSVRGLRRRNGTHKTV